MFLHKITIHIVFPFLFILFCTATNANFTIDYIQEGSNTCSAFNIQDSLALVALYNATNGPEWKTKTNWLTGPVSTWHGITLTNDRVSSIYLRENNLTGILPKEIGDLAELKVLDLAGNGIGGSLPSEIGLLTKLGDFNFRVNNLTGEIPRSIWSMKELTYIDLSYNQLKGNIPSEIGKLTKLTGLLLGFNQLTGTLPVELGQLSELNMIYLPKNQFSGSIPSQIGQLVKLTRLTLGGNQLTGTIPPEICYLTELYDLDLAENKLSGPIPGEIGNLSKLSDLVLMKNNLTGDIPQSLWNLTNLRYLELSINQLTGSISPFIGKMTKLTHLLLGGNQISGNLPVELGQLSKLIMFWMPDNRFSGPLPSSMGQLTNLTHLVIDNNQISGSIPPELGNLSKLEVFHIGKNLLTGNIPPQLGQLTNLYSLLIAENKLTGNIPNDLTKLTKLKVINASSNQLEGSVPAGLFNLPVIDRLHLQNNHLTGLPDFTAGPLLITLNTENNRFTFEDYETNMVNIPNFTYVPQARIGQPETITLYSGDSHTLNVSCGGTANSYEWFFNGTSAGVPGSNSAYKLTNITANDAGEYFCRVTNSIVPGLTIESEPVNIRVTPSSPPTGIILSNQAVPENEKKGAFVGKFSTQDPDANDKFTYSLISGEGDTGNSGFKIAGDSLLTNEVFNFYFKSSYSIRVQTKDKFGNTFSKNFTISITEVNLPLKFPDVFTPNGDGYNDYFLIENIERFPNRLTIFDRWGKIQFQKTNYLNSDPWDGTSQKNELLPSEVYFYVLEFTSESNVKNVVKGTVLIRR